MNKVLERLKTLKPIQAKVSKPTQEQVEDEEKLIKYVSNGFASLKDRAINKPYILDEGNLPTICFLHYYFANAPFEFKKRYPNHDLRKGLFVTGKCGTGKTALLRIFKHIVMYNKVVSFSITSTNAVVREYDTKGSECLEKYIIRKYLFDDFGSENQGKYYGKQEEVFKTIIEERYNQFIEKGLRTHLTSNLTLTQVKERYGDRVFSRLHEMFNIIVLDGADRRI